MKTLPALTALLISLTAGRADFIIEQNVDGLGQQSGKIIVKIKDLNPPANSSANSSLPLRAS